MYHDRMNPQQRNDLVLLRAQRQRLAQRQREMDLDIGRQAGHILATDKYATKSSLGRLLGVSHTHVGTLIDAARNAPATEPPSGIPVLDNTLAADYVLSRGAVIRRSISAFHAADVLFASGLDPRLFDGGDGWADVPNMLWQLDSGDWVGVSQATVGYGGTGCGYSYDALVRAGVRDSIARAIVSWRFCDTHDFIDGPVEKWTAQTQWPMHARSIPLLLDDRMIIPFGEGLDALRSTFPALPPLDLPDERRTDFFPTTPEVSPLGAWIEFLDSDDLPSWAQGPRVARAFRTADDAADRGFTAMPLWSRWASKRRTHPCIVVEQGAIQLWGFYYRPADTRQYLPDEAYDFLARANVHPQTLRDHDKAARSLRARFNRFFSADDSRPGYVDISEAGNERLAFEPSEPLSVNV